MSGEDDKPLEPLHNEYFPALSTDYQENTEVKILQLPNISDCRIHYFNLEEYPIPSKRWQGLNGIVWRQT